jgi:hypothetical protein
MAIINHTPAHVTTTVDEKKDIADANYVERVDTHEDLSLAKVEQDAKLDAFGARSKTNPEEIALVKKLDRTILVSISSSTEACNN